MKSFISFVFGVGVGALGAWLGVKGYYRELAESEINSVKEVFYARDSSKKEEKEERDEDLPDINERSSIDDLYANESEYTHYETIKKNYSGEASNDDFPKEDEIHQIITRAQYEELNMHDKVILYYYAGSNSLIEEDDSVELDIRDTLGEDALSQFDKTDEDVIYVRNNRFNADYEVVYKKGAISD